MNIERFATPNDFAFCTISKILAQTHWNLIDSAEVMQIHLDYANPWTAYVATHVNGYTQSPTLATKSGRCKLNLDGSITA